MAFLKNPESLYINGEWVPASEFEAVINPADESLLINAPVGSAAHVDAALQAARDSFDHGPWRRLRQSERQAKLTAFLDAIERRKSEFIRMIVAEAGPPSSGRTISNTGPRCGMPGTRSKFRRGRR